jgi:phosphotransferase system enzyme I (PtsI)
MGVGLFRSEFLFMNHKDELPEEEEQFAAYRKAMKLMKGRRSPSARSTWARTSRSNRTPQRRWLRDRAEPGAGSAGDPLEPVRAADVHDAIARHPARIGVRHGEDPDGPMLAHAQEVDQTLDLIREAKRQLDARVSTTIATCRSAR